MPRIRTIKPEYWGDEKLARLDPTTRLVFLALISLADDAGRLTDNVKTIDGFVFPETDDSSRQPLDTLASMGRILRYQSESGQKLIQVSHWSRHQKVDHPNKYVLPAPPTQIESPQVVAPAPPTPTEILATISRNPRDSTNDLRSTTNDLREAVDKSTGTPNGKPAGERNPHLDNLGVLMPVIRTQFYAPDGKPPPDYDDGRDAGIVLALLRLGIGEGEIRDAIEGAALLRDDGQLETWDPPVRRGDKLTMRVLYHTKRGVLPMLTEATNYLDGKRKYASAPAKGHRAPATMGTLVAVEASR